MQLKQTNKNKKTMKRIIIFLFISVVVLGGAKAQNSEAALRKIYVNSELGYPLSPASSSDGTFHTGVLSGGSVDINNSLPTYKLGAVPNQQIWHNKDLFGFYVSTDTLDLSGAELTYTVEGFSADKINFDSSTGRFLFYPDSTDISGFTLTLHAETSDEYIVTQDVQFGIVPTEGNMYTYLSEHERDLPDTDNYFTMLKVDGKSGALNGQTHENLISYSFSGMNLVLSGSESESSKNLSKLNEFKNLSELNLYAERIVVKSPMSFYSTNVNIYANEIIFEDGGSISTSSTDFKTSGNVNLYARKLTVEHQKPIFYMTAGEKQGKITYNVPGISYMGTKNAEYVDKPYEWLHPNWLLQAVNMLNDAFIDQQNSHVQLYCNFYTQQIEKYRKSDDWKANNVEFLELESISTEMRSMNNKISNGFDYFGNPQGFMPMLSFEVNKDLYDQEIDRSIKTFYFAYLMKNADNLSTTKIEACKDAIKQEKEQLATNIDKARELTFESNKLQSEMTQLVSDMDNLSTKIDRRFDEFMSKAQYNINQRNKGNTAKKYIVPAVKWVTTVGVLIGGAVAKNGDIAGMAFDAGDFTSDVTSTIFDWSNPPQDDRYGDEPPHEAFYNALSSESKTFSQSVGAFSGNLKSININDLDNGANIGNIGSSFVNSSTAMMSSISKLQTAVSKTSVSSKELQTELNKLMAESPDFTDMIEDVQALNSKKEAVIGNMFSTFNRLVDVSSAAQKGIFTIDALNVKTFEDELKKDFKAMLYVDNMAKNAEHRLLRNHYYMGRSYEYSFLEPYQISLNTQRIFDRCAEILKTSKSVLTETDFNALKQIYEEDLATVEDRIIKTFQGNKVPQKKSISYTLNSDQLATLNSDSDKLIVNLFEDGKFPLNEVDIRILDININKLDIEVDGTQIDPDRYFDLVLVHEGNSRFIKNGKVLGFSHKSGEDVSPIKWGFRCFQDNEISKDVISPSNLSLLNSILSKVVTSENVFAKPAGWGYLTFERSNEYNDEWMQINIKKLQLKVEYETVTNDNHPIALISASNNLVPNIELKINDVPCRSVSGFYAQTFDNKYSNLQIKAPAEFGEWRFSKWVDQNGKQLSVDADYDAGYINSNKYFRAAYEKTLASLQVVEAYDLPAEQGYLQIKVENGGSSNLVWSTSPDDSTPESDNKGASWLEVKAGKSGVNNGYITVKFEENMQFQRTGVLKIFSNAGDKEIVFTQKEGGTPTDIEQDELAEKDHVTVYVRENGLCYVDLGHEASSIRVELYDMNGRIVEQLPLQDMRTFDFDISKLSTGVYVFKVLYDGETSSQKLVKY